MAFKLGNFSIDEILFGTAQNFEGDLLYTLDQLKSASIEISAESNEIVDKKGNVVRNVFKSKSGTFNSTNAFLHPNVMNAGSGSDIEIAGSTTKMPKMVAVPAGGKIDITDYEDGTLHVVGLYGSGANTDELTESEGDTPSLAQNTYVIATENAKKILSVPPAEETGFEGEAPVQYVVRYDRVKNSGYVLKNSANDKPKAIRLTLYCSYVDPCDDDLKPCYVYIPSFMPDANMTISLDSESQELDYNGTMQLSYCSADKVLYYIYFPDEDIITTGTNS